MLSSQNHWKCTSPEENALPGRPKWHGKCNKKHQKHEKRMLTMKTIRKQWTDFRILLFRKCTFSRGKVSHFVKPTRKQEKNTGKTHEQTWKKDEQKRKKWKIRVSVLWELISSQNTHITEENALRHGPGATEMTPKKIPKTWKPWKTYVTYDVNWKAMKRFVNPPVQEIHVFSEEKWALL